MPRRLSLRERLDQARRRAIGLVLAVLACLLATGAMAEVGAPEVNQLRLERADEGILLSANVSFELSSTVEDALAKGIPMYFVAEAAITRDRWYWYDKQIASAQRYLRLSYQPLTRRWRLLVSPQPIGNSGQALGQTFETREEALAAVRYVSRWKVAETGDVDPDARHTLEFKFRLDVSQLPRPFQIGAVGHAEWNVAASRTQRVSFEPQR